MNVVAVDDEPISLDCLEVVLSNTPGIDSVHSFLTPTDTLEWFSSHTADIAFLDIEMKGMNGLALAAKIREAHPDCSIIFVTSHRDYAVKAFQMHVDGYLMKPVKQEDVQEEIEYLKEKQPEATTNESSKKIKIRCFGNFDVFYNDNVVKFSLSKSKELFAYLIHRKGSAVSMSELAAVLFEDKNDSTSTQSQIRNLISDMKKSITTAGIQEDLFVKSRGYISIKPELFECDYYDFLNAKTSAVNSYSGEYMAQYSWAEFTVGYLESLINK